MASAEIQWPQLPVTGVLYHFTAFGVTTADSVLGLLRLVKYPDIIYTGNVVVMDDGFWAVEFPDVPWNDYWNLELYESPGLLLARVPNLFIGHEVMVGIQYPRSSNNPIPSQFIAQGFADPGGTPSGTMELQTGGDPIDETQVVSSGKNWSLRFQVGQTTTKYNLHVDVTNSGGTDSKDLCVPPHGQSCV
jgi:hypothetical protein